jgi:hypothetical protein
LGVELETNAIIGLSAEEAAACRQLILDRAASLGVPCDGDG